MGAKSIYKVPILTCGVYSIRCKVNSKQYIGASVNVANRLSQHFRIAKNYNHLPLYADILKYGRDNFEFELLEQCERETMLEREQYYYDLLQPEYNLVRPCECMFKDETVRNLSSEKAKDKTIVLQRKMKYNTSEYKELFRSFTKNKMRSVVMFKDNKPLLWFESIQEASRWVTANTNFKGKNKTSKIKSVCDGERPTAYGYKFKYSTESVTTIPKGSTPTIDTLVEAVN